MAAGSDGSNGEKTGGEAARGEARGRRRARVHAPPRGDRATSRTHPRARREARGASWGRPSRVRRAAKCARHRLLRSARLILVRSRCYEFWCASSSCRHRVTAVSQEKVSGSLHVIPCSVDGPATDAATPRWRADASDRAMSSSSTRYVPVSLRLSSLRSRTARRPAPGPVRKSRSTGAPDRCLLHLRESDRTLAPPRAARGRFP